MSRVGSSASNMTRQRQTSCKAGAQSQGPLWGSLATERRGPEPGQVMQEAGMSPSLCGSRHCLARKKSPPSLPDGADPASRGSWIRTSHRMQQVSIATLFMQALPQTQAAFTAQHAPLSRRGEELIAMKSGGILPPNEHRRLRTTEQHLRRKWGPLPGCFDRGFRALCGDGVRDIDLGHWCAALSKGPQSAAPPEPATAFATDRLGECFS